jgi:hypothetical protein
LTVAEWLTEVLLTDWFWPDAHLPVLFIGRMCCGLVGLLLAILNLLPPGLEPEPVAVF